MSVRLSVLINNFNYARYLPAAIDSVLDQDYPDFEVVVVDDGSTDNSREVIAKYGAAIVAIEKPNGGQASSFNAGFAASSGEIVFLLDADDAFLPGKLRRIADVYNSRDIGWCFDRVTVEPDAEPPAELRFTPVDRRARMRRGAFPSIPVPTSGLSFRREVLAEILPMPVAADVVLSDNYLKFAAAYLAAGLMVETPLTFQRIHDNNRYTGRSAGRSLRPRIMVETGFQLARRYDGLRALGQSLVAGGLAEGREPLGRIMSEIRRCTRDGTFGATGPARLAALVAYKRVGALVRQNPGASP